jgi:hypothetical protein
MGSWVALATGHPLCRFVLHSVCFDGTDPTSGFCLGTLSFGRPKSGLAASHSGSPGRDYLGTMRETTRPRFVSRGASAPV